MEKNIYCWEKNHSNFMTYSPKIKFEVNDSTFQNKSDHTSKLFENYYTQVVNL